MYGCTYTVRFAHVRPQGALLNHMSWCTLLFTWNEKLPINNSPRCFTNGNGAPAWVCDGHNYTDDFRGVVDAGCDFIQGVLAPDGRLLQDHFVDVWRMVARHYAAYLDGETPHPLFTAWRADRFGPGGAPAADREEMIIG